ncbi:MAG: thioredoxin family protein [Ignavibacteriales bacterium]|nr:thioredoxin family protein [Ignavibacteriales bacterium]
MKTLFILLILSSLSSLALTLIGAKKKEASSVANVPPSGDNEPRVKELGLVKWMRGFESAQRAALESKKPLLILFQEVPGCATCVGYGEQVLSHPLVVEAIESEFVPLAVYNNISGGDRTTLQSFDEPSWNNPVVRIVTADRQELVPRLDGDYSQKGLTSAMVAALKRLGRPVPAYIQLLDAQLSREDRPLEQATFAMSCFWTGEAEFGSVDGVLSTKPGFVKGHEVVDVTFDPSVIPYKELVRYAKENSCAVRVFTKNRNQQEIAMRMAGDAAQQTNEISRPDDEPKYYLSRTLMRFLPMTEIQAMRVNAAIAKGQDPDAFLSPRQRDLFRHIQEHPKNGWKKTIGGDFSSAWHEAMRTANRINAKEEKRAFSGAH